MYEGLEQTTRELPHNPGQIATEQFFGIKRLYRGIRQLTTVEERDEVANSYNLVRSDDGSAFERHDSYSLPRIFHNIQTLFDPGKAYDLADEFHLSETGLVRDTLTFDNYWSEFNLSVDESRWSFRAGGLDALRNAIDTVIRYDILASDHLTKYLQYGKGALSQDEGDRFLDIINTLNESIRKLSANECTKPFVYQAINDLSFQINKKLNRLGIMKGVAEVAGGFLILPAIGTFIGAVKNLAVQLERGTGSTIVDTMNREPITPLPKNPTGPRSSAIKKIISFLTPAPTKIQRKQRALTIRHSQPSIPPPQSKGDRVSFPVADLTPR